MNEKSSKSQNRRKRRKLNTSRGAEVNGIADVAARSTVSIALPGSVIENSQTLEQATALAGQLARTAAIFNIDEVVVVDDSDGTDDGTVGSGTAFLARVLQFMETPQYLRKALIPMHGDLRLAGLLPPLDAPHHMRAAEWRPYREGVVLESGPKLGSIIDVGLEQRARAPQQAPAGMRVTVHLGPAPAPEPLPMPCGGLQQGARVLSGRLASAAAARDEGKSYWGYEVRIAQGLSAVFDECPHQGGYDVTVGTSERGTVQSACNLRLPAFRHLLIAFGGPEGLERCLSLDPGRLRASTGNQEPASAFHHYINTCPNQGSRTIRTEEAVLISLAYLQPAIDAALQATLHSSS